MLAGALAGVIGPSADPQEPLEVWILLEELDHPGMRLGD
jgi:hypothetical protein